MAPMDRPPKVFISYSHDNPAHDSHVLEFAQRLRMDGVDATIDQFASPPPPNWPLWMEQQIQDSDFVLIVCSRNYIEKLQGASGKRIGKGVAWESRLTYQHIYDSGSEGSKFIPVLFQDGTYDHIPAPLRSAQYYRVSDRADYANLLRHLTGQPQVVKAELGELKKLPRREVFGARAASSSKPWNVPLARNRAFTGREEILLDLRAELVKETRQALFGLGGVGKTQIALEYVYRYRDDYTAVFWVYSDSEASLRNGYASIAVLLNLPEKDSTDRSKIPYAVISWLEDNPGWLLVLDNADDPRRVKPFLPHQGAGHVLLTSRAHTFQNLGIFSPREINVLSPSEAREFLLLRTGNDIDAKSSAVDELAKELGYLPLALEQGAAYIAENQASFEIYLTGFKRQRLKLLDKQGAVLGDAATDQQKRTVSTTWALNFADIERQSPPSADLLQLSAFFAPDLIPFDLLATGGKALPRRLAAKLAEAFDTPLAMDELLSPLLRFSLIRRDEERRAYSIHPLVQEMARNSLDSQQHDAWADRAVRCVSLAFPDVTKIENWPACERLLPHALACANFVQSFKLQSPEAALLLKKAGYYLDDRGEYSQAEQLYRLALVIDERTAGPEHPSTASSLNNLGLLLRRQGKREEAEGLFQRAIHIDEKALGPEHPDTAIDLNNLADLYRESGRLAEAEPLYRRALAILQKALGPHPSTALSLSNLALLLREQKNYAEAESLLRQAIAIEEQVFGLQHPQIAIDLGNLADLYLQKERFAEAENLYRRALAIQETTLGPDHPSTAGSLSSMGTVMLVQGKYQEAEPLYRRSVAILERTLGPEHPRTAQSLSRLGELLQHEGRFAEAELLYRRTLAVFERTLAPEHPRTARNLNRLGEVLQMQGRTSEAESLFRRALAIRESGLQPDHPDIIENLVNMAAISREQSRFSEAVSYLSRALTSAERTFGPDGKVSLDIKAKLANVQLILQPPEAPAELVQSCVSGNCVLFAGSGLSARSGLPTWHEYISALLDFAEKEGALEKTEVDTQKRALATDVNTVADNIVNAFRNRSSLLSFTASLLDHATASKAHELLCSIPFAATLTSNLDNLLETTFYREGYGASLVPQDSDRALEALSSRRRFMLKLYGTIDRPESVLLSPTEYRAMMKDNLPFRRFMEGLFFSKNIFFLGCSLNGILDFVAQLPFRTQGAPRHYALVAMSSEADVARAESVERQYNIQIVFYGAAPTHPAFDMFLENLTEKIQAQHSKAPLQPRISRLHKAVFTNIGPFENLEIPFESNWKVLLGDNGVGKTSILRAIAAAIIGADAGDVAGRLVRTGESLGTVTLFTDLNSNGYVTEIYNTGSSQSSVLSKPARPLETEQWLALGFPPLRTGSWQSASPRKLMKAPPNADDLLPLVRLVPDYRMDKLKDWIVSLYEQRNTDRTEGRENSVASRILDKFFQIASALNRGLEFRFEGVTKDYEVLLRTADGVIRLEAISQGMASFYSWVGILVQRMFEIYDSDDPTQEHAIVLMDEIDAHLHPNWQTELVTLLQRSFPNVQMIVTTHSPLIVGGMQAGEVTRLCRDEAGKVRAVPVSPEMLAGRADQTLTDAGFNLATTLPFKTQELINEYKSLLGKSKLSPSERSRLKKLESDLEKVIPTSCETPVERVAEETLTVLETAISSVQDKEAKARLQELAKRLNVAISNRIGRSRD